MRPEAGSVLLQVLLFSILGLLLSSILLSGLMSQTRLMRREREGPQAFYAAESGVNQTIQHLINAISKEDKEIDQFRVLVANWNRPAPFVGSVGPVTYQARIVDISPNLAFRAYANKYADVTIEAEVHEEGSRPRVVRATYRLGLGPAEKVGERATRIQWEAS